MYKSRFPHFLGSWLTDGSEVVRLAMGWTTRKSEFVFQWGQEFSLLHIIQTSYGAHPASYPIGTGGSFPRGKSNRVGVSPPPHLRTETDPISETLRSVQKFSNSECKHLLHIQNIN
jgi:hypothetical protein